jgi:uncharacterized cupin superfamily protein
MKTSHCLINRGNCDAVVLEIGSRAATERAHYCEVDMLAVRVEMGARFTTKDGTPF